jgi:hypothetical protein
MGRGDRSYHLNDCELRPSPGARFTGRASHHDVVAFQSMAVCPAMRDSLLMLAEIPVDLQGYYPTDITGYPYATKGSPLSRIIEQAWEMGDGSIRFIHGHGRGRGLSPGFVNNEHRLFRRTDPERTAVRRTSPAMDQVHHARLQRRWVDGREAQTNPSPTRTEFDGVFPERRFQNS